MQGKDCHTCTGKLTDMKGIIVWWIIFNMLLFTPLCNKKNYTFKNKIFFNVIILSIFFA